eukprot:scaffold47663_cov270-Isochrysis_galbana.AAC.3
MACCSCVRPRKFPPGRDRGGAWGPKEKRRPMPMPFPHYPRIAELFVRKCCTSTEREERERRTAAEPETKMHGCRVEMQQVMAWAWPKCSCGT